MSSAPASMAVLGGGRMGIGIAQVFAAAHARVTIVESDPEQASAASERFDAALARGVERGKVSDPEGIAGRVHYAHELERIPHDSELVVEAVPEDLDLKRRLLAAAEGVVSERTVLATNTSALPIAQLAEPLDRPGRFLGMHFFNPVPASALVELVVGPSTSDQARTLAQRWVEALDKTPIVVNDAPGFATSRLGVALGLEAIRMLSDGVASAEAIDTAMELGYRHRMGPLRLTDLVGLDVRLAVAEHLQAELGERFAPPQLLRDKVANGELGRKTGQGFYAWP